MTGSSLEYAAEVGRLAAEILDMGRTRLMLRLRFLSRSLWRLEPEPLEKDRPATDGERLLYAPEDVIRLYREDPDNALRVWLHPLLHCLFRHMFVHTSLDRRLWNLASDIAVEDMMAELEPELAAGVRSHRQRAALAALGPFDEGQEVLVPTAAQGGARLPSARSGAEWVYRALRERRLSEAKLLDLEEAFRLDDHDLWYGEGAGHQGTLEPRLSSRARARAKTPLPPAHSSNGARAMALEAWWRRTAESILMEDSRPGGCGKRPGRFEQAIQGIRDERCDYRAFLRKFAALCEVPEPSLEEFDLICYTYGLSLYRDMPLLEPLEYREDRRIRELAIVIDTSGSVRGKLVQSFLQRTFSILRQEGVFSRRFHVRVLQCDSAVQRDTLITCREDLDALMREGVLRGFGGTDFRPAFEYAARLQREGSIKLQGLLYLTDGKGIYPKRPPDFPAAFVFLDRGHASAAGVPPWAIRVILSREDVIEL